MNIKRINQISVAGYIESEEYGRLREYLSSLPIEVGSGDSANVEILFKSRDLDQSKLISISPSGNSFESFSVNDTESAKKLKFSFYASDQMHYKYGKDDIIICIYNKFDENQHLKSQISELEEKLKLKPRA